MLFGGTGKNVVNPAVTGRIFIFISFQWAVGAWALPKIGSLYGIQELTTSATAVVNVAEKTVPNLSVLDMLLGTGMRGCIGETCKLALIAGGIYLAVRGIINILYPVICIACAGLTAVVIGADFALFLPAILSGGLILGAIFMATDYTTTPNTFIGNIIYFATLGILVSVLRYATNMETVSFAIILMNLTVPLIDKFILQKPFGYFKPQKTRGAK